jgi:hypothetical protein
MKAFAGIGSRQTPDKLKPYIFEICKVLVSKGYTLRSGGADGADSFFEEGYDLVGGNKEIFLPWKGFNANKSPLYEIPLWAYSVAAKYHPHWHNLKKGPMKLHARNAQQVLGKDLNDPVEFVICWTPDGCNHGSGRTNATGGTGQAISIASDYNIPVYNIQNVFNMMTLEDLLYGYEDFKNG